MLVCVMKTVVSRGCNSRQGKPDGRGWSKTLQVVKSFLVCFIMVQFSFFCRETKSGDVLTEIDNMLQGLTDELDAMLEFEMQD